MDSKLTCNSGTVSATTLMTNLAANDVTANSGGWQGITTTYLSLKSCLSDIVSRLNQIKAASICTYTSISGHESGWLYSTYNGRKFSDYDIYVFFMNSSQTDIRGSIIATKSQFYTGSAQVVVVSNHGSSLKNRSGMIFDRDGNDTNVYVKATGSQAFKGFEIIGIKL